MHYADRLLADVLRDHLPADEAAIAERQIPRTTTPHGLFPSSGRRPRCSSWQPIVTRDRDGSAGQHGARPGAAVGCPLVIVAAAEDRLTGTRW
jgi:hypothetical protein